MRMLWVLCAVIVCGLLVQSPRAQTTGQRWWQREAIRFLQTNLSETDSTVDPDLYPTTTLRPLRWRDGRNFDFRFGHSRLPVDNQRGQQEDQNGR